MLALAMAKRKQTPPATGRRRSRTGPGTDYDGAWKEALERFFEACGAFFFPHVHADIDWNRGCEMLDKELQKVMRQAGQGRRYVDKLVKVWLKSGAEAWLLIHVEVQTWKEADFPKRMHVYNYRLFDRYDHEVISLAVLADDDPNWRPTQFGYGRWGFRTGTEFPIVKLLDYGRHWEALEASTNPFATVVMAHLKTMETRQAPADRQACDPPGARRLVKGLYDRGLKLEEVVELSRLIDWLMDLPPALENLFRDEIHRIQEEKRMPFISVFERGGYRRGLLAGIEVCLEVKFGQEGLKLLPEIRKLEDHEVLEAVLEAMKTADSPDEVRRVWAPRRRSRKGHRRQQRKPRLRGSSVPGARKGVPECAAVSQTHPSSRATFDFSRGLRSSAR
jgi:hypothetical protein